MHARIRARRRRRAGRRGRRSAGETASPVSETCRSPCCIPNGGEFFRSIGRGAIGLRAPLMYIGQNPEVGHPPRASAGSRRHIPTIDWITYELFAPCLRGHRGR